MPVELYDKHGHKCLMFTDLNGPGTAAVQSNQFLIVDDDTGALIDPGGNLAYHELCVGMSQHFPPSRLSAILASHADPDIIGSLDRWLTATPATLYISALWVRFAPHFCKPGKTEKRIFGIRDAGMRIRVGRHHLWAIPAHFLHAEGNFQFWDPTSRILFSGDLAASLGGDPSTVITSLAPHLAQMEPFHRPLHGEQQDPSPLGPHGRAAADRDDRSAARVAAGRSRHRRVHRLGADARLRHRPHVRARLRAARLTRHAGARRCVACREFAPHVGQQALAGILDQSSRRMRNANDCCGDLRWWPRRATQGGASS